MEVIVCSTADNATESIARLIAEELRNNPRIVLGLATGRSMEGVYGQLVSMHRQEALDFSGCHTFNLDEYVGLAADSPHSYWHYMNFHLFSKVNIGLQRTHLPDGRARDLAAECAAYEKQIANCGGIDLQLLGIGLSGHIGFNEPLSAFSSRTRVTSLASITIKQNAPFFGGEENMPRHAITVGIGTILGSRRCLLLATGEEKSEIIAKAIEGPMTSLVPATALQWHSNCTVVLDEAAAGRLNGLDGYRSAFQSDLRWRKSGAAEAKTEINAFQSAAGK